MLGIKTVTLTRNSSLLAPDFTQLLRLYLSSFPLSTMQLTLLASLAVLCSAAFAAPSERRGDSLAEIIACAYSISWWKYKLIPIHRCGQRLERYYSRCPQAWWCCDQSHCWYGILSSSQFAANDCSDVQDDLDNLTVKVLTPEKRDNVDLVDVEACKYPLHNFSCL